MRLAVIPGDGIGPEVIEEALKVLDEVAPGAETTSYDLGAARWHSTGELLPESVLTELQQHDAILLGAVGDPSVPSGILERGLLLRLRFELDHHVNLRPARLYPGVRGPLAGNPEIDMVVVREGTEGPYVGTGGLLQHTTLDNEQRAKRQASLPRCAHRVDGDQDPGTEHVHGKAQANGVDHSRHQHHDHHAKRPQSSEEKRAAVDEQEDEANGGRLPAGEHLVVQGERGQSRHDGQNQVEEGSSPPRPSTRAQVDVDGGHGESNLPRRSRQRICPSESGEGGI